MSKTLHRSRIQWYVSIRVQNVLDENNSDKCEKFRLRRVFVDLPPEPVHGDPDLRRPDVRVRVRDSLVPMQLHRRQPRRRRIAFSGKRRLLLARIVSFSSLQDRFNPNLKSCLTLPHFQINKFKAEHRPGDYLAWIILLTSIFNCFRCILVSKMIPQTMAHFGWVEELPTMIQPKVNFN